MRAQRVAAATVAVGLVSVCCAASISAGSASTSDSVSSVKAVPGADLSKTTVTGNQDGSNTTGDKVETSRTSSTKTGQARSSKLRKREVFTVSEKEIPSRCASAPSMSALRVPMTAAVGCSARMMWHVRSQAAVLASWQFRNSARDARTVPREQQQDICGRRSAWSAR